MLISKKDVARKAKTLFKVRLQVALYCVQLCQKETFPTHFFLGIFRVITLLSKCFAKVLRDHTAKVFLSTIWKASKHRAFACALESECSEKNRKASRKMSMSECCFSNISIMTLSKRDSSPDVFRICSDFFRDSYFTTLALSYCMYRLHVCLVIQIILIVVEMCQGNCQNLFRENTESSFSTLVKSHRALQRTEVFAQKWFRKKL